MSSMISTSLPSTLEPRNSWATMGLRPSHDLGVVPALVEHTHIQSQHVGEVHGAAGSALVRADDHHVVAVDL